MSRLTRRQILKAGAAAAAGGAFGAHSVAATPQPAAAAAAAARTVAWQNWSGSATCAAQALATPGDEAELVTLLRGSAGHLRCVGAGHSFTALVPTEGSIVSLDRMSGLIGHDKVALTATLQAGTRLAQLSRQLDAVGLALPNLPDIDAQSFAGAISTATHGTGRQLQAVHAGVTALRLITPSGEVLECSQSQRPDLLAAAQVSLGSLGVITQATVRVVPAFQLRRNVWLKPVEQLLEMAPQLARQHRHFEFYYLPFTGYAAAITHDPVAGAQVNHPPAGDEDMLRDLRRLRDWAGRYPDLRRWVAKKMIDPDMREQATDRSYKLLTSPRPTRFNESECHVASELGIACVRQVIAALEKRNDVFFPMEFRFVKGDDAWLSPFYQRDSCSIAVHAAHGEPYDYLVSEIAPVFRKYGGRPHWGKLHGHSARDLAALYPRWHDFLALRQQLDPRGRMLNAHLAKLFGVSA